MGLGFRNKMIFFCGLVVAICSATLIAVSVLSSRSTLLTQIQDQMSGQGHAIKAQLIRHQDKLQKFALQISDSRLLEGMYIAYEGGFYGATLQPGKDQNIYKPYFETLNKTFFDRAKHLANDADFSDLILVSTNGQVIFSLAENASNEIYLGRHIEGGIYKDTQLADCYKKAKGAPAGNIFYSGFEINPVSKKANAFVCMPKFAEFDHNADGVKKGDLMGTVLLRIDQDVISSFSSPREGMGETGVGYILGKDLKLRTAYKNNIHAETLEASLADTKPFISVAQASSPKSGVTLFESTNHYDDTVIRYIDDFTFFDTTFKLVIEKNMSEVMTPSTNLTWRLVASGLLVFFGIILVGMLYLNKLIKPLLAITQQATDTSQFVMKSAETLTSSSDHMTEGSQSAASSLQQTVSSLEEISSQVKANAENSDNSYHLSQKNTSVATEGSEKISQLIDTMKSVAEQAKKIEEITSVIDDIAFQTNLLALNAAVEAARAGEQGKGFAVVAEAVRTLAQKSAISTKEISSLIKNTVEIANSGKTQADSSGQFLTNIVNAAKETSEITKMISDASREQATGLSEVNKAINHIDQVMQKNAGSAVQVKEHSQQLQDEADTLQKVAEQLSHFIFGSKKAS